MVVHVFHVFSTCHGGSCFSTCHGGSCFSARHVFTCHGGSCVFTCHGGSCLLTYVLVVKGLGGWVSDKVGVKGWNVLFLLVFFGRDGKGIVGGKVLLQVPPRKDNSLSALSCGIVVRA